MRDSTGATGFDLESGLHDRLGSLGERALIDPRSVQMLGVGGVASKDHSIELRLVFGLGDDRGRLARGSRSQGIRWTRG